jgi:hypothetical protein
MRVRFEKSQLAAATGICTATSQVARAYGAKLDYGGQPDLETVRQVALQFTLVRIHLT